MFSVIPALETQNHAKLNSLAKGCRYSGYMIKESKELIISKVTRVVCSGGEAYDQGGAHKLISECRLHSVSSSGWW